MRRGAISLAIAGVVFFMLAVPAMASPMIVTIKDGVDPASAASRVGVTPTEVYRSAINGYAADLTKSQLSKVKNDAATVAVEADTVLFSIAPSSVTTDSTQAVARGVRRVGALESRTAAIDGVDTRIDADVVVVDTGIDATHPDLNVVGGINCAGGASDKWGDTDSHGTMVAGIIGGIDNDFGQVGIAPGVRLWAAKVTKSGAIPNSKLVCALDWVVANADMVDVVNLSLGGVTQQSLVPCGIPKRKRDAVRASICAIHEADITLVAAAGNSSLDIAGYEPARMPEVIAVSALSDSDGLPGGLGGSVDCQPHEADDTIASFSNFGAGIALAAPGVCIGTTAPGGGYALGTGTSFSAPFVSGAAALLVANNPAITPTEVRIQLIAEAEVGPISGDPDNHPEGVLSVRNL